MSNGKYCVYQHVFPNGKQYIGITNNVFRRWKHGEGYVTNKEMYKAIQQYGWENIRHNILADNLTRGEAQKLEKKYIKENDTINHGYNKSEGGAVGKSYLSYHVSEMLHKARVYPIMREYVEMYLGYADNEDAAIMLNYADLIAKTHRFFLQSQSDEYMCCCVWIRLVSDIITGIDVCANDYNIWKGVLC